jgi:Cu+-exporting ATPase
MDVSGRLQPALRLGRESQRMNRTYHLRIPVRDLGCGDTRRRGLERVLGRLDGVLSTSINPVTETAYLEVDPAHVDVNAVARAIAGVGCRPGRPVLD